MTNQILNDVNKLHWSTRIIILCIIAILSLWIIVLMQKNTILLNNLETQLNAWSRFTYEDWLALYKIVQGNGQITTKEIVNIYWTKNTDYKNFLLIHYDK